MIGRGGCYRGIGAILAGLLAGAPVIAAPAKVSVDTDVRLGYDMNPFLSGGSDLSSGYATVVVSPSVTKQTEKGEIGVSGYFEHTQYQRSYGHSNQYGAQLDVRQKITPKLSVYGGLSYDNEVIGQGRSGDVVTGPPIDDTDVNLIGLRRRSETYQATGGWEYQLSQKDTISADANYSDTQYGSGPPGADSRNIGGRIGWRHAISARTKIGISGSATRIEYDTPGLITWIMEPAVTFSQQISQTWNLDARLGMSFSKLYLPAPLLDQRAKGLSGNINLCHKGIKDDFCFYGARSVTGSGAGGTVERTQLGFSYNRRLTETLRWAGTASYMRSKSQSAVLPTREYINARGGLIWRAKPWLNLGAEARFRDVYGAGRQIRADYGGELSATVTFPGSR